jgi:hypothetical protein
MAFTNEFFKEDFFNALGLENTLTRAVCLVCRARKFSASTRSPERIAPHAPEVRPPSRKDNKFLGFSEDPRAHGNSRQDKALC